MAEQRREEESACPIKQGACVKGKVVGGIGIIFRNGHDCLVRGADCRAQFVHGVYECSRQQKVLHAYGKARAFEEGTENVAAAVVKIVVQTCVIYRACRDAYIAFYVIV